MRPTQWKIKIIFKANNEPSLALNILKSNAEFIDRIQKIFKVWCPIYFGNPRGKLSHFKKNKSELVS